MTRRQQYLIDALSNVTAVRDADINDDEKKLSKAYGGLCHTIPMLVRNDGLAQAVAWIEEKAQGHDGEDASSLKRAYHLQRVHLTSLLLGTTADQHGNDQPSALVKTVRKASNSDYIRYTTMILDAWVYYKRFASSLLDVDPGARPEEEEV